MKPHGPAGRRWMYGNKVLHLILFALAIKGVVAPDQPDCPQRCICKWVSGKKTALCISAGFISIPNLQDDIQILDLKNNKIQFLNKKAFSSIGLVNLQRILMSNTTLEQIHKESFDELLLLIEVDLSDNFLSIIPKGIFSQNLRLKTLTLSGNPLKVLRSEQFPELPHLRTLELENCQLHTIEEDAFVHLATLENLNLNSNKLEITRVGVFSPIVNLKSLSLYGNPWRCDCDLKPFRNWYLKSNLYSVSVACSQPPDLNNHLWEDVIDLEFRCHPRVYVTEPELMNCDVGDNVTLHCHVAGDPEPRAVWYFNGEEISRSDQNDTEHGDKYLLRVRKQEMNKWFNITILDLGEEDSGVYSCMATNYLGDASSNLTIVLPELSNVGDDAKVNRYWFLFTGLVVGGLIVVIVITSTVAFGCMAYNRKKRRKHIQKAKAIDAKGYYDQEKQLLDMSSTNTEQLSRKSSREQLDTGSVEMLKHPSTISIDRYSTNRRKETTAIIPLASTYPSSFNVYPPPPEFSNGSMPHSNTLGNIFISVSLSPDPSISVDRFPDLLDSHRRAKAKGRLTEPRGSVPFATLPRRPLRMDEAKVYSPKYDNMGRRITVGGSSTMSLNRETIPTPPPPPLSSRPDFEYMPL